MRSRIQPRGHLIRVETRTSEHALRAAQVVGDKLAQRIQVSPGEPAQVGPSPAGSGILLLFCRQCRVDGRLVGTRDTLGRVVMSPLGLFLGRLAPEEV